VTAEHPTSSTMQKVLAQAALVAAPLFAGAPSLASPAPGGGGRSAPETVQIKTEDGQTLSGSFYKPTTERAPGVILVHDAGASRAQLEPLADRLSKQGFGVLTIDLRGHGASKGKLDWEKLSEGDKKTTWTSATQDVDAAADWLHDQPSIHSTSLSLLGYGAGCALAVRHAKNDENVVCMALLAPKVADYGFDVRADIQTLEGLPTFVVTSKDAEAERMAQEANASSGNPYVELLISPPKLASPLDDKALPARVSKWLSEKAMPKKGK
jgi:dienelactone hydrolase